MEFKRVATDEEMKEYKKLTNNSDDLFCAYQSLERLIVKRPDKYDTEEVKAVSKEIFKECMDMYSRMMDITGDYSLEEW